MTSDARTGRSTGQHAIELHDLHFPHSLCAGGPLPWPDVPFHWDRTGQARDTAVYTDMSLIEAIAPRGGFKVAWMMESPAATRKQYAWLSRNADYFDRVLTFEQSLLENLPQARFVPLGGCWIGESDWKIHPKTHNLSVIASAKRDMEGQKLRHKLIKRHNAAFDSIVGFGYCKIDNKVEGLADFRYSLTIENCRRNYYFSEKLIDCLMTGTVPIYWGCPSIGLFFDMGGIIAIERARDFDAVLAQIGPDDYARRLPAIKRNLALARRYVYPEVHVWENICDRFQP